MRLVRAALLALLTAALAGLGVPSSFAQTAKAPKGKTASSKRRASGQGSPAKNVPNKRPATGSSASAATKRSAAASTAKNSTASAKRPSGKSSRSSASKKARKQPGQKAPTADRVSEIQAALTKDGSFQGSPNGKWDDDTSAAVRRFQASHGLNPSGKLDAPTLQRLGLGSQTAGLAAPTPPPGAVSRLSSSANVPPGPLDPSRQ
jgi:peptidoglycan hydrolase-like protein with peptidoglycan-binding domain